jgi:glycosyltransferase involved in cell wall biosynthesis
VSQPLFSVFIPTFNRERTLPQALQSVLEQTFADYELLIVDDGSEDRTPNLVAEWQPKFRGKLRYIRQSNQGKHVAYNRAAQEATGELLVLLDSDDSMLPEALQTLAGCWHEIPASERDRFAGVEGLCQKSSGELHGTPFPRDRMDSDYLEITRRYGVSGEKRHAIRSDILRRFPYPVVPGERHVRPSYVWKQIAHHYRFRYINAVLQTVDFRSDGLTRNASRRRLRNPGGLYLYWRDDILYHNRYRNGRQEQYAYAQYIRYALLSGHGPLTQWREVPDRWRWIRALPKGLGSFVLDRLKQRRDR